MPFAFVSLANVGNRDDVVTVKAARLRFYYRAASQLKKFAPLKIRLIVFFDFFHIEKRLAAALFLAVICHLLIGLLLYNLLTGPFTATGNTSSQTMMVRLSNGSYLAKPSISEAALAAKSIPTATDHKSRDDVGAASAKVTTEETAAKLEAVWQSQYQLTSSLHRSPKPLTDIEPVYPERAGRMQGTVTLRIFISETGNVDKVIVVKAFPMGFFEESAIEAFSKAQFAPGRVLGVPVKSQMTIEVAFSSFTDYRSKQ